MFPHISSLAISVVNKNIDVFINFVSNTNIYELYTCIPTHFSACHFSKRIMLVLEMTHMYHSVYVRNIRVFRVVLRTLSRPA